MTLLWDRFWRHLAPFGNTRAVAVETFLVPLMAVGLGIWLNPLDPLWARASFPWAWFAPLLLSLRYGPLPGLIGAALLFGAWHGLSFAGWSLGEFPRLYFLGGLIMVMLTGEFSSVWVARARRAEGTQLFLDQRLEYLTRQHYLLRLSHDRLEQDLLSKPMAMRDALLSIRGGAAAGGAGDGPLPGAAALMRLLAQICQLEVASLHPLAGGEARLEAAATLGQPGPFDLRDPLVERALATDQTWHLQQAHADGVAAGRYLIAAPLVADGAPVALLVVERMPFFALQEETLQTLKLLLGYYADGLALARLAAPIVAELPACPTEFAGEAARLVRVARDTGLSSTLVSVEFWARPEAGDLVLQLQRQKRGLDLNWVIETPNRTVLVTLMPLAGPAAAEGYFARVDQWVKSQLGPEPAAAGIFIHSGRIDERGALAPLLSLLTASHVVDQVRAAGTDA
jgi:hypothetical protein